MCMYRRKLIENYVCAYYKQKINTHLERHAGAEKKKEKNAEASMPTRHKKIIEKKLDMYMYMYMYMYTIYTDMHIYIHTDMHTYIIEILKT